MRPEKFWKEMDLAFEEWFESKSTSRFQKLKRELKRVYKKQLRSERDYRIGEETYGYDSPESIYHNMMYISDRWNVGFRLKWLIDGLEEGKF